MADRRLPAGTRVLLLIGLGPDAGLPLAARERADAALVAAGRAAVPVVTASLSAAGADGLVLPEDGQVDDATLHGLVGSGARSVALAGVVPEAFVTGLRDRLASVDARLVVLGDATHITPAAGAAPAPGPRPKGATISAAGWIDTLGGRRSRRRRTVRFASFGLVIVLLVALVVWSNHEAAGYYTLSPGSAPLLTASDQCVARGGDADLTLPGGQPCARVVVPASRAHAVEGSLFMVDVLEGRTTWSDYVLNKLGLLHTFRDGSQLFPASSILGSTPADQLSCQNGQEMVQATTDAPVAALQRLGYDVHEQDFGAQVDLVIPGYSAASAGIACNDLLTSVDGKVATTVTGISQLLAGRPAGTDVTLGVTSTDAKGTQTKRTVDVKLGPTPAENGAPADPQKGFLGVELETRSTYRLPFGVSVDVGDIGGPSAGLAITLAIINVLSGGKLTGGHHVAATGTIAPDGSVGDVGGVAQKTVAVRRAGATVFLVPPQELSAARSEDGGKLKVIPVSSLTQALAALSALGGTVPAPTSG